MGSVHNTDLALLQELTDSNASEGAVDLQATRLSESASNDNRTRAGRGSHPLRHHVPMDLHPGRVGRQPRPASPRSMPSSDLSDSTSSSSFFNIGGEFLVNFAGFIIPGYYSLDALFSANKVDDTQWLTYWVVYAFLTVFESLINAVYWFPFYYVFKFILILWMALPVTNGAQIVFRSFIQPVFSRFFSQSGSTAADVRGKADAAFKSQ